MLEIKLETNANFWTHDAIKNGDIIGRINEPIIITTTEGVKYLPTTIVYLSDPHGNRKYKDQTYRRNLVDYVRDIDKLVELGLEQYLLKDEKSGVRIVAVPIENSEIVQADTSCKEIVASHPLLSQPLIRLTSEFPEYQFGVIGSMQLGLEGADSDIDLFIYGGKNFMKLQERLNDPGVQRRLMIAPQDIARVEFHARRYQERYGVGIDVARRIAQGRARYTVIANNGRPIRMGINSCFEKGTHSGVTILNSKFLEAVNLRGTITDIENSCSFPRQYMLDVQNNIVTVASHHWGHQLLAQEGDKVQVAGNLRELSNGRRVVFLENDTNVFNYLK